MVHINYTHRRKVQMPGLNTTRIQDNPRVVICRIGAKKSVQHNEEIKTPPRNSQIRHIGCICVLPDSSSKKPNPRRIGTKTPYTTAAATGLKIIGPPHQTPEGHPGQSSDPH